MTMLLRKMFADMRDDFSASKISVKMGEIVGNHLAQMTVNRQAKNAACIGFVLTKMGYV